MKKNTHPKSYPAIFIDTSCGAEFVTTSTLPSEQEKVVDGVAYKVHLLEISSASHPFYTGKQMLIDTARRAEKFQERVSKAQSTAAVRKGKKAKKAKSAAKKEAKKKEIGTEKTKAK